MEEIKFVIDTNYYWESIRRTSTYVWIPTGALLRNRATTKPVDESCSRVKLDTLPLSTSLGTGDESSTRRTGTSYSVRLR